VDSTNKVDRDTALADKPYSIAAPKTVTTPLVFASPHSGRHYPQAFLDASRLNSTKIRRSEDAFVEELYGEAPVQGAPLLRAHFPRAYVDPNREPYELDPAMFESALPKNADTQSPRVAAGLGTVARVVTSGEEIYRGKLKVDEALQRIDALYKPYHQALSDLIEASKSKFGICLLIDCHSMPSIGGPMDRDPGNQRVDFVLGDCHGNSCSAAITDQADLFLSGLGYAVRRNNPYAGGFTTRHYGDPTNQVHALQIEVNRDLYMDERLVERSTGFSALKENITKLIAHLCAEAPRTLLQP